jgi:hypothetical protein
MRASNINHTSLRETIEGWRNKSFTLPSSIVCGKFFLYSFYGSWGMRGIIPYSNPLPSDGKQTHKKIILTSRKT